MPTTIYRVGSRFSVEDADSVEHFAKLPVGNYVLGRTPLGSLFLERAAKFEIPDRLYGSVESDAKRFLDTYEARPGSTGVLLCGEKGSGKSLTAKVTCDRAVGRGIPTVLVNFAACGDGFNKLVQGIDQPCIFLFDEFEKVYAKDPDEPTSPQQGLLTLLDGVCPTRKLFLFTCNARHAVDSFLLNRPGRVFYALDFEGLSDDFIRDFCRDKLKDQSQLDGVLRTTTLFRHFTFDSLQALVEEMNRYGESATTALRCLNIKPDGLGSRSSYDVEAVRSDRPVKMANGDDSVHYSPLQDTYTFSMHPDAAGKRAAVDLKVSPRDLESVDGRRGRYVYKVGDLRLTVTEQRPKEQFMATRYIDTDD